MRRTALAFLAACGGHAATTQTVSSGLPGPAAPVPGYEATRWVPAHPTYVLASRATSDFQQAASSLFDAVHGPGNMARVFAAELHVDPLSPEAVFGIGIDPGGGLVMFSEDLDPTLVVHLSAPDHARDFFARQMDTADSSKAATVDGVVVTTAVVSHGIAVSWAIDRDWLWVHLRFPTGDESMAWFEHSHRPTASQWAADWSAATRLGDQPKAAKVLGFIDSRGLLDRVGKRASAALACARVVEPIQHVGVAFDGDLSHFDVKVAFEIGARASEVQRAVLPPPPGWAAVFGAAPVDLQLNLDLDAFQDWVQPCADLAGIDLRSARKDGVRALRLGVASVDKDASWGTGAIAVDLERREPIEKLLDQIPMRSHIETDRTFGSRRGHRIQIPFKGALEYVLEDHLALLALGDGLAERLFAGTPAGVPPLMSLDVRPAAMPVASWRALFDRVDMPGNQLAHHIQSWRAARIGLTVEQSAIVLEISGNRN
jgi:hypothetical protein